MTKSAHASNAKNGMMTSVWGPSLWFFLHSMSFNYPIDPSPEKKQHYANFVLSIQNVLPCRFCRENFPKNLEAVPLTPYVLKNRKNFSRWMYRFHAHINSVLGKPTTITFEEVEQLHESFRAKCSSKKKNGKKQVAKEKGCVAQTTGVPRKCVLRLVPKDLDCASISVSNSISDA